VENKYKEYQKEEENEKEVQIMQEKKNKKRLLFFSHPRCTYRIWK
jgi:hypothetical protein